MKAKLRLQLSPLEVFSLRGALASCQGFQAEGVTSEGQRLEMFPTSNCAHWVVLIVQSLSIVDIRYNNVIHINNKVQSI